MKPRPFFLLALCLMNAPRVFACATIDITDHVNGNGINIADESALIVWDKKTQTEHFIRRANFEAKSKDFGFLVPTPSKPELAESDDAIFTSLQAQMKPKVERRIKERWLPGFLLFARRISSTFNAASAEIKVNDGTPSVEVWEQKRVGNYDAAVLRANDADALKKWLKVNSYALKPEIAEWLKPYIARKWFITAFKIRRNANSQFASSSPVRLSFRTPRPFYPYHEPTTQQKKAAKARVLHVFLLSDQRFGGRIESETKTGDWPGRTIYSAPLQNQVDFTGLIPSTTLAASAMRLTVFEDSSSPRPGYGDLYFSPSHDQATITPPPIIIWKYETRTVPLELLILAVSGLFWFFVRKANAESANEKSPV